ncbi:alpha/beta-hydrolase [Coniochaeta ligniaria NRRL 30616]|uniref:Alpha/beta-hydrolase n=1 Tax=Coniochaeta ligniaria NRRL 30616 TaxID=1408157 RepID=A0A1J7I4K6_9PEZI|nr:alpha/beta-hydrolase [Coniochaeta ligniaria NRRL 30616]
MADFSYMSSAPSSEWTDFEKTWKPPSPPATASVTQIRDLANAGTAKLFADVLGRPEAGLDIADYNIPTTDGVTIPVRLYSPRGTSGSPLPLYISFHGGGYYMGSLETEDPHCRQVVLNTGAAVLNVNYRHTPDWTFPAPVDDAWAAFQWARGSAEQHNLDPQRIYVGGVSAGGTLAITTALRALGEGTTAVKGLFLATPVTVHPDHFPSELVKNGRSSLQENANAPFINAAKLRNFMTLYQPDPADPECSPLLLSTESFSGLCPTWIHVAGLDPLRDEGLLFEERLRNAGVKTTLYTYPGIPHAFMSLPKLPSAALYRERLYRDLKTAIASSESSHI